MTGNERSWSRIFVVSSRPFISSMTKSVTTRLVVVDAAILTNACGPNSTNRLDSRFAACVREEPVWDWAKGGAARVSASGSICSGETFGRMT